MALVHKLITVCVWWEG